MLAFMTIICLVLVHQSFESDELEKLLKMRPTWSFEVISVESMIKEAIHSAQLFNTGVSEDILRAKIEKHLTPGTKHIVRKTGDPKWSKDVPHTFDAREKWPACKDLITDLEDEGACYADSSSVAASVAGDRYCVFTNGTFRERLSHEMLAGCAESCTRGGSLLTSIRYITEHGIPTGGKFKSEEGCVPYEDPPCKHSNVKNVKDARKTRDGPETSKLCNETLAYDHDCPTKCSNGKYPISLDKDLKKFTTWYYIRDYNEYHIRREIFDYGPVAASITFYEDFYEGPKDGWYWHKENSPIVAYEKYLKLIGWGEEKGIKYWLAVNTWDEWGSSKVFKIKRGTNHAWVEYFIIAGVYDEI